MGVSASMQVGSGSFMMLHISTTTLLPFDKIIRPFSVRKRELFAAKGRPRISFLHFFFFFFKVPPDRIGSDRNRVFRLFKPIIGSDQIDLKKGDRDNTISTEDITRQYFSIYHTHCVPM